MLKAQYNCLLAERFNWYQQNHSSIDACSLVCYLPELKDKPNYYVTVAVTLKKSIT